MRRTTSSLASDERVGPTAAVKYAPLDRNHLLQGAGVAGLGLAFALATGFWSFQTSYILDDYVLCSFRGNVGDVWGHYWELTGPYRPITYPVTALRAVTCDAFVIHKVLGFVLHLAAGWMLLKLAIRLRLEPPAAVVAVVVFLFSPFALEAMAWPAVVYGYPLATVFLLGFAIVVLSPQPRLGLASVLALLAATTNEQTLGLVVLLPLVASGSWRERSRREAIVLWPVVAYALIVGVSASAAGISRAGSFGPQGVANLIGNSRDLLTAVARVFPPGSLWRAFQAGPGVLPPLALAAGVLGVGLLVARSLSSGPSEGESIKGAILVAIGGAVSVVTLMAPFYAQEPPWLSPRYLYMPYAGFGLTVAALFQAAIRARPRLRLVPPLVSILLIALVGDGLLRDANAYRLTYEGEQAIASDLSAQMAAGNFDYLVLVDSPWTLAPGTPLLGEHVVHAFTVRWAVRSALITLVDTELNVPVIMGEVALCDAGGSIRVDGVDGIEPSDLLVYDVGDQGRVATVQLASGGTVLLGGVGGTYDAPSC